MRNPDSVTSKTKLQFYSRVTVLQTASRISVDYWSQNILALIPSFLTVLTISPGFNT